MSAKEIRAQARGILSGNWGTFILLNVMYALAVSVLMLINQFVPIIGYIVSLALIVPLAYSYIKNLLRLRRKETNSAFEFFKDTINNFGRSWCVAGRILLKILVPLIIVFVALVVLILSSVYVTINSLFGGASSAAIASFFVLISMLVLFIGYIYLFVKALLYILTTYIAIDNPQMSASECVNKSATIMNGNRLKYVFLCLSFIGWMLLCVVTFGIGLIALIPYMSVAFVCFYEDLSGIKQSNVINDTSSNDSGKINVVQSQESNEVKVEQQEATVETNNDTTNIDENNNPIKQ